MIEIGLIILLVWWIAWANNKTRGYCKMARRRPCAVIEISRRPPVPPGHRALAEKLFEQEAK